jgi:uncharacterized damage-inducible protein DinB
MQQTNLIASRLREVLLHGKWIANTNFKEQLENLDWQQAIKQVAHANSIALLTFHINYYMAGLLNVLKGGKLNISDKYSFDMPSIQSDGDWQQLVSNFLSNAERFAMMVEQMPDEMLNELFVDEQYGTWQRNLEAVMEHSYYHLGQIVFIRKLILHEQK